MNHLTAAVRVLVVAMLTTGGAAWAAGPTGLLNDTGQTTCYDGAAMVTCTVANTGDAATYPRQDGRFGRDVANPAKVGGGAAGFDFTKVCMNGTLNCTGAANTGASPAATEWACTKDNVTNLIWSLQTQTATWNAATVSTYPDAGHNSTGRCGYNNGWRLPTVRELLGIVHNGLTTAPAVDINYFPASASNLEYLTNETFAADSSQVWVVAFGDGHTVSTYKTYSGHVRLVRSGQ